MNKLLIQGFLQAQAPNSGIPAGTDFTKQKLSAKHKISETQLTKPRKTR
jgi:hypothetical protein